MKEAKDRMEEEVKRSAEALQNGGIILYPTDTIWGIGCDATNEEAVSRIIRLKQRADSKSMIVLLDNEAKLPYYITRLPEQAWQLLEYSEKPLTLILPGARNLAANVIAADGSAGIRVVKDEFCRKLIAKLRKPLVSTSANISGKSSPANYAEVSDEIKSGVDYVVNLRREEKTRHTPSSIIQLGLGGEVKVIR